MFDNFIVYFKVISLLCFTFLLTACSKESNDSDITNEKSQALVLLRGLPTKDTLHSIAIVELDPSSTRFGEIFQDYELPNLDEPLHHLYYSPTGRLYATGLDPKCSLMEIKLTRDTQGAPNIQGHKCLETQGQVVGEDIIWHNVADKEYMFVTFMGGGGIDQPDGGSVGVFDAQTNQVIKIIDARKSLVGPNKPFIMYPHGISAYQDRMIISSTAHPDLKTGVGNTITVIDLNTLTAIETITIEDSSPLGLPSSPVEVLFLRPSIVEGVQPGVLVNTMLGFETWFVPYNEQEKLFSKPLKLYDGATNNTGVPLEFYGTKDELFISHGIPGVVKRYHLDQLPKLVPSGPDIKTDAGAHHMIFFTDNAGNDLIAVQNNLLNLGDKSHNDPTDIDFIAKLNAHTVSVHNLANSERIDTINFKQRYGKGIENIEALFGSGFVHHH